MFHVDARGLEKVIQHGRAGRDRFLVAFDDAVMVGFGFGALNLRPARKSRLGAASWGGAGAESGS